MEGPNPNIASEEQNISMYAVLEENFKKSKSQTPLSGAELAAAMKIGTRVVKGADWKWGDQVSFQNILDAMMFFLSYQKSS